MVQAARRRRLDELISDFDQPQPAVPVARRRRRDEAESVVVQPPPAPPAVGPRDHGVAEYDSEVSYFSFIVTSAEYRPIARRESGAALIGNWSTVMYNKFHEKFPTCPPVHLQSLSATPVP